MRLTYMFNEFSILNLLFNVNIMGELPLAEADVVGADLSGSAISIDTTRCSSNHQQQ